ncbi:enoyl-CoA hydratase/isomerase family protein [Kineosporia succinea]|uniref:2-(1,2-epoxy-1,2-dihydrophenyl)acetyl-CoA isomerase n=1 Tax=Kineosporia succinea TaxID=84632 RepID=A0ABT9NZ03_9ACTN|nr:enoyl-CoA hydratase-related protein [Kineosporia succinea]MDP9825657.1 2-(1,2-epoxy-1,2-dihydrophenyl)acetyl-CoA isomerase [Kineosporia succinea]
MTVTVSREGAVAVVTIDRPRRRNALDAVTKKALRAALVSVAEAPDVRAVVLTGAGGSFCGGQDLAEHAAALAADASHAFDTVEADYAPIVTALATMPKPVIAAVSGTCVGAGLALALACDLRVFADDAVLSTAFTAIGLTCDSGLSLTLTRSVGESRAKELLLLGSSFSPAEAVSWGVAGSVVPGSEVLSEASSLAGRLAAGPTRAYAETKSLVNSALLAEVLHREALAQARLGLSHDHPAAVSAFLAKERPSFEGR